MWFKGILTAMFLVNITCQAQDLRQLILEKYKGYKSSFSKVSEVMVTEIKKLSTSEVVFVDVRSEAERNVSIIPGAIDQAEFEKNLERFRSRKIIVYCTIGFRSGVYTQKLNKKGVAAHNLVGGVLMWAYYKNKFVRGGEPTNKVHVYGKEWNLLPQEYIAIW